MTMERNIDVGTVKQMAEILKTIGHPLRLKVLEALEQEEPLSVSQIQDRIPFDAEQSLLSHHLIKMKDRGVLSSEKKGMHVFYRLEDRHILKIFDCMQKCELF
ncbi:MAG: helix-turn-helix transcriptional regulator [Bacteroidetes bacterium]|nr:helix-turn-helix transcriptional regulator [Bacteroidota bacterium]